MENWSFVAIYLQRMAHLKNNFSSMITPLCQFSCLQKQQKPALCNKFDWLTCLTWPFWLANLKFAAKSAEVSPHSWRWACLISKEKLSNLRYSFLRYCANLTTFIYNQNVRKKIARKLEFHTFFCWIYENFCWHLPRI